MTFRKVLKSNGHFSLTRGQKRICISPKDRIAFNRSVSDWCLRNAAICISRQAMEEALQWDTLAARVLSFECAVLMSPVLEKQLIQIGNCLKPPEVTAEFSTAQPKRWLHVLTTAYSSGGHTAMLKRWIHLDPKQNQHSVVLLEQTQPVPEVLTGTVQLSGGEVICMDFRKTLLARAAKLREITWTQADVVVLHIHPWEVIVTAALALHGGPPVLLVNHAAHIFWVGASITDMILNCRHSPQEDEWTDKFRGINKIMHLPIPIPQPEINSPRDPNKRQNSKRSLHLPEDAIVMLTIGLRSKYSPLPGIDFFNAIGSVMKSRKNVYLIAVGPNPDEVHWIDFKKEVGERLLMTGNLPQSEISTYFNAADLYLEGFPFGSTTAVLEAGAMGIPCVLPPKECPPPFTSDGIALKEFEQIVPMSEYVRYIQGLIDDENERIKLGELLARSISAHHCNGGWAEYLSEVQKNLPVVHSLRKINDVKEVPENLSTYWAAYSSVANGDPFSLVCKQQFFPPMNTTKPTDVLQLIQRGKTGYAHSKLAYILMDIGDHFYWKYSFLKAFQFYGYSIKQNYFQIRIFLKCIFLLMGHRGVKAREKVSKCKHILLSLIK